jgi:hypothetical protein
MSVMDAVREYSMLKEGIANSSVSTHEWVQCLQSYVGTEVRLG